MILTTDSRIIGIDSNNKQVRLCRFEVDDISDLPAPDVWTSDGVIICMGSTAHVIGDNSEHMLDSSGNWVQQQAGSSTYTRAEIDAITLSLQNQIDAKTSINGVFGERISLSNVDLNDITTPNKYVSGGTASTGSLSNCPATSAFIMFVDSVASSIRLVQRIYEYDTISASIKFYIRAYISSGWGTWYTAQLSPISP